MGKLSLGQLHDIATVSMYEKNYRVAREYSLKAVQIEKGHVSSYKVSELCICNH